MYTYTRGREMSKAKEWIMVRIPRLVHKRLVALSEHMDRQRENGFRSHIAYSDQHGVPLYAVIGTLLDEYDSHKERCRKSRQKRREGNTVA